MSVTRIRYRDEFERYLTLQDCLYNATNRWVAQTPADKLDWAPIDNPNVRFGDRVRVVTIKSLYVHVAVEEYVWLSFLRDCEEGALIPLPARPDLTEQLASGELLAEAARLHAEAEQTLRGFTDEDLAKTVRFAERTWTVMGFLWALYAHRSYHLGNIDIYLRQSDTPAPNFFRFPEKTVA